MRGDTRAKITAKMQNVRFPNKNAPNLLSLRGNCATRPLTIFTSQRYGIPEQSTGVETRRKPITKTWDSPLHSALSLYSKVLFRSRSTVVRYGMANRFVKDCRVGQTCALLVMTRKLAGFMRPASSKSECLNRPQRHRNGASPKAPLRGQDPHFHAVSFTRPKAKFRCAALPVLTGSALYLA